MMVLERLYSSAARFFRPKRESSALRLRVRPELELLPRALSAADAVDGPLKAPGIVARISHSRHIDESELMVRLEGRVGGSELPPWADGSGGAPEYGVCLCRIKDALYTPEFGALITPEGCVLHSSVAEALYFTPDLSALPGVAMVDGDPVLFLPDAIQTLTRATVFMAWGGRFNYGHFVLDCLPALCTVAEEGLLDRYPVIAPKLDPWHRDLLRLLLGSSVVVQEVNQSLLRVRDAIFATPMDHFLHAPGAPISAVRERIFSNLGGQAESNHDRIYLSRMKDAKRPMLNERELESRLQTLGFVVIHPQNLGIEEQIVLFRDAKVIVGATGAAFANCLFCAPSTQVFEIQPSNYAGIWARGLCLQMELDWFGYFAPSPEESEAAQKEVNRRAGAMFAWRLAVDDFMTFLTERLDGSAASVSTVPLEPLVD